MLRSCIHCKRHIRDNEACPFCAREEARVARRSSGLGFAVAAATAGVALASCGDSKTKPAAPETPAIAAPETPVADDTKNSDAAVTEAANVETADAAAVADTVAKPEPSTKDEPTAEEKAAAKQKKARELAEQRKKDREAADKPTRPDRPMVARYGMRPQLLDPVPRKP